MSDADDIAAAKWSATLAEACRNMNNGQPAIVGGQQLLAVELFYLLETIDYEAAARGEALIKASGGDTP